MLDFTGAQGRNRTTDTVLFRQGVAWLLYLERLPVMGHHSWPGEGDSGAGDAAELHPRGIGSRLHVGREDNDDAGWVFAAQGDVQCSWCHARFRVFHGRDTGNTAPLQRCRKKLGRLPSPSLGPAPKLDDEVAWTQFIFVRVLEEEMLTRIVS